MNSERGTGASPGQQDNANPDVQTGQPNSQNDLNSGQPGQPNLELLYQLSEQDRAAIMALPPGVRDPAVAALHKARVDFETGMHEQLAEGRQAIANEKVLFADPRFQEFMVGANQPPELQSQNNTVSQPNNNTFGNLYETPEQAQQADAIIDDMANKIGDKLNIEGINTTLQNLQRGMLQNTQDRDWQILEEYTKENNLPDPNGIKSQIYLTLRDNPGLPLDKAYTANVDLKTLVTRPSITSPAKIDGEDGGGLPAPTQLPGTSKSSAVPETKTEVSDPVEAAYKRAEDNIRLDPEQAFKDAYGKAIADYNEVNGTTYKPDDFQA